MTATGLEAEERIASEAGSFDAFFEAHHARLYGTLCLVTARPAEAEDLLQEAFLRMWERWDRLAEHPDLPGYLYRTAFNLHRSGVRRAIRTAKRTLFAHEPVDEMAAVVERQTLFAGLKRLPRRQRTALVLLDLMDLSSEEAAKLLGIRPVTVRVLASQARTALREGEGDIDE
jgi:RNA polymerase sigma-70 factor, ECF subfamily